MPDDKREGGNQVTAVVDAQIAGGNITVGHGRLDYDPEQPIVVVDFPGSDVLLFPHEAHELIRALQEAVQKAELPRTLKRSPDVDEGLQGLGDV